MSGTIRRSFRGPGFVQTGDPSSVAVTTTAAVTVFASGAYSFGTITNEGLGSVFVCLGDTASATNYTVPLAVGAYYEIPFGFNGLVTAIGNSGASTLRVTTFT